MRPEHGLEIVQYGMFTRKKKKQNAVNMQKAKGVNTKGR
jgi:hypothetical protein